MSGPGRPPEWVRLCDALRELRAGTGLSLAALAARTPYSKSSWDRYLNGRTLPPRQAVEELCLLAGADPRRPVALWELAETAGSGRTGGAGRVSPPGPVREVQAAPGPGAGATAPGPAGAEPGAVPRRLRSWWLGAALLVAAGVLVALFRPGPASAPETPPAVDAGATALVGPGCHGVTCSGKDPEDSECSTFAEPPTTLGEQRLDGTMVKVRHSAVCDTVWARIDRGREGDLVQVHVPGGPVQKAVVKDRFDSAGSLSTPMAAASGDARAEVRACLVRGGEPFCFTVMPA
ncbi:helix-turn-helix domain-containing protein [Streptomyces sp. NPDC057249]|uniref:helix-turn-helix domain-containing protein n=1 Tax=Streptomyces sp. NPDC057249 TaxID=3346067 RepID=UPI003627EAFD